MNGLIKADEEFIDLIRKNYLALKSNQQQVHQYQAKLEENFVNMAEKRPAKIIPFQDGQIDAGNSQSVYNANELVNIAE